PNRWFWRPVLYQLSYDPLWSSTYPMRPAITDPGINGITDPATVSGPAAANEARVYVVHTPDVEQEARPDFRGRPPGRRPRPRRPRPGGGSRDPFRRR